MAAGTWLEGAQNVPGRVLSQGLFRSASTMVALEVTRWTMTATRRGSGMIWPHSYGSGRFEAKATEAFFSRSVEIWNSS
jgi:hypothetical protein